MPRIHPKADVMQALVEGLPEDQRKLLRHALGCGECQDLLAELLAAGSAGSNTGSAQFPSTADRPPLGRVLPWREHDYGRTIDGVLRRFQPRLSAAEREQAEAPAFLKELLRHPPERRLVLVRNSERFQSLALADLLLQASREEGYGDPRAGEQLASLALSLTETLDPQFFGARVLEDARARAWLAIANARRIASDLRGADEAVLAAEGRLREGTHDRLERARLLYYKASLRRAQRRFPESAALYERAIAIYLDNDEEHLAGEAMVARALACKEAGEPERAIGLLQEAGRLIDPADQRLRFWTCHNLIHVLAEAGRYLEAQALLARSAPLYRRFADAPTRLRLLWVRGRIARGVGRLEEAAGLFRQVRAGFIEQGIGYDAALVSLDLAGICAQLGETAEMKRLAEEMLPIFQSRDVHREALAALIVFQQAAAAETATLGLVEEVAARLRRASGDAATPFESEAGG
ncbi:MAG TPA: tetratricopeptide repeat protein [Thermoanaerobaculia bacterium]|nr:tetratricopeptide repeat protein [Thermoanaerobaculia bacterium]